MKTQQIDFNTTRYFPGTFIFLGALLFVCGLVALTKSVALGLLLFLISAFLLTTTYGMTIDMEQKRYHDYLWMLGYKKGKWHSFERVDYFFIKKRNASQTMHMKSITNTVHKPVYDGYLRFSEEDKVFIATYEKKSKLLAKLKRMAKQLEVEIVDYDQRT
ncbi:MAG: hypothetical protein RIF33_25035 [Cyclobacteriaceae bacterium]